MINIPDRNKSYRARACLAVILAALAVLAFAGCGMVDYGTGGPADTPAVSKKIYTPPRIETVEIALVGDIMVHKDMLVSAYDSKTGGYSFAGFFSEAEPYLSSADLTIGNLETTVAGPEKGFTGYPQFNTPSELLTALRSAGFDVLTTANNHSLDRREYGVLKTIENLESAGLEHTGTFSSAEERGRYLIIERNGIKTGILAYTYGTNGIPVPQGKDYLVNLLDMERIKEDIIKIRNMGADIVLVYPHFGIEYRRNPGEQEKKLVEELFAAGADIVAGSHPHVLQPMERRDREAGKSGFFAAYSLGNFISGQRGRFKDSGVIVSLKFEKNFKTNEIKLIESGYIPTWVHKYWDGGRRRFRIVAVEKAKKDYEDGKDSKLNAGDYARLKQVWEETGSMLSGPGAPELRQVNGS
ncbi:MAG: poly-gamma-glutamate biosynthesis protein [Firmicutes bacterium HGW-Firmicutes-14]|nr:MAG: poly-gamma-glutamate biosynthesis protein [Firmicutes bacterium HGW-Firmicutes-14]